MHCALYETGTAVVEAESSKELLFVELFYVTYINNVKLRKKIFRSNLKLTLLRNLFILPCSLYFSLFLASPDELFLL